MDSKRLFAERTVSRRKFNSLYRQINQSLEDGKPLAILNGMFEELKIARHQLIEKHENYSLHMLLENDSGDVTADESNVDSGNATAITDTDTYLEEPDTQFRDVESRIYMLDKNDQEENLRLEREASKALELAASAAQETRNIQSLRNIRAAELASLETELKKVSSLNNETSETSLNSTRSEVKHRFENVKSANEKILSFLNEADSAKEIDWLVNVCVQYQKAMDVLDSVQASKPRPQPTSTPKSPGHEFQLLQKMPYPTFDGTIRDYPRFKSNFTKFVMPKLDENTVSYVLSTCLKGEPAALIKSIDDDAKAMWKRLDEVYGDLSKVVDSVMLDLKTADPVQESDHRLLVEFIDKVEAAHADLQRLKMEKEISNSHAVSLIEEKLPRDVKLEWSKAFNTLKGVNAEEAQDNKFSHLLKFLKEYRCVIEYADASIRQSIPDKHGCISHFGGGKDVRCLIHTHSDNHDTSNCRKFLAMNTNERVDLMNTNKACFSCLDAKHVMKSCPNLAKCTIDSCEKNHHTLLHEAHVAGKLFHLKSNSSVLLQIMNIFSNSPRPANVTVLWDSAGEFCLITFSKAKRLGLKGQPITISIEKVGGDEEVKETFVYKIPLKDRSGVTHYFEAYGIDRISSEIRRIKVESVIHLFPGTSTTELERPSGEIDILIGYNYAASHPDKIMNPEENLVLLKNSFGQCLGGSHRLLHEGTIQHVKKIKINLVSGNVLQSFVETFIKGENMGTSCFPKCGGCRCGECSLGSMNCSIKEQQELNEMDSSLELVGNHFETSYVWVKDPNLLHNNKHSVEHSLVATEKRLEKDKSLKETYMAQWEDLIERGVAVKLSEKDIKDYDGPVYYLSHHEVLREDSASTPCRIVFNSSKKFRGQCINDFWAKGADLLNNPLGIVLRFREQPYAMTGDIRKMFQMIKLKEGLTQHVHRCLWRSCDTNRKPDEYVLTTVTFGDRPAPCIAGLALKRTAELSENTYPEAAKIIKENTYVDDIADSFASIGERNERKDQMSEALKKTGFHVKEWVCQRTNDASDNDAVEKHCISSLLGCLWDTIKDILKIRSNVTISREKPFKPPATKRLAASVTGGCYDPNGFGAPILVKGKIYIRKLWIAKLDWDDPIPGEQMQEWMDFIDDILSMENIPFKRSLKPVDAVGDPMLVIFCDGSEEAYGAVAYIRWRLKDGGVTCRLVLAKSRIAPMKPISIVRLELNGALLGKRLKDFITKNMRYNFEKIVFLVDSKVVHAMVKLDSYGFHTYPALRIGEIQESTDVDDWWWLEGSMNIADCLTRTNTRAADLGEESEWQNGAEFLKLPVEKWPTKRDVFDELEIPERKADNVVAARVMLTLEIKGLEKIINIEDFSDFVGLKRTVAWIIKACNVFKGEKAYDILAPRELHQAEDMLVKIAQKEMHNDLSDNKFRRLCAHVDNGIVYVGGRAERWMEATWNKQKFVLLPFEHHLSYLIALHEHDRIGHLRISATVSAIRSKFWIIKVHKLVKKICDGCLECKKRLLELQEQKMADLPIERLKPCPPFTNVGLDYCGPFTIKGEAQKRIHSKCYGVIIVCMTMRAVYIDLSPDYATDTFLQLLRRFGSRHGWPATMHSDCGSQLKGASEELKKVINNLDGRKISEFVSTKNATWSFVPPDAPWMNGVTESLVKSVKKAMGTAIGTQILTFSELQTVLFECSELVNERPIGRHPTEPADGTYLCPNDLILGRSSSAVPQGNFDNGGKLSRRFRFIQSLAESFWRKWTRDYFPSLLIRSKWHVEHRNVQVGDIVLLKDSNAIHGNWRLGRVTKTVQNEDNLVRRIHVRCRMMTDDGKLTEKMCELERAIHNVIVIVPVDEKDDN